ncbi:MAG: SpoIID/LytB domain-containing protein [Dermatophilaceae bacterium]
MRRTGLVILTSLVLLASWTVALSPPAGAAESYPRPASGSYVFDGRGYGHGRGMSQWGAQGAALAGLSYAQIVSFYFPGSTLAAQTGRTARVRITADNDNDLRVQTPAGTWAWDRATGVGINMGSLGDQGRVVAAGDGTLRLQYLQGSDWVTVGNPTWPGGAAVTGPVEFTGSGSLWTYQPTIERQFRGTMLAVASGAGLTVVNQLSLESYLYGVVPRESPSSWSAEALRAQGVVARSYASFPCNEGPGYDLLDTTSCQVYGGQATRSGSVVTTLEASSTTAAVDATAGRVVTLGGVTQRTEFSSSNGGWTVASGAWPAKADPYDGTPGNPRNRWTGFSVSVSAFEQAYPAIGGLVRLEILQRNGNGEWGGRVTSARLVGQAGSVTMTGEQLRTAGGLYSSWVRPTGLASVAFARVTPGATTEMTTLGLSSGGTATGPSVTTGLGGSDNDDWRFFLSRDADLVCVRLRNTGSGKVEVHTLTAASGYTVFSVHAATAMPALAASAPVQVAVSSLDRSGAPDLWLILTAGTGTGTTELHVLSAASHYQQWTMHSGTAFGIYPPGAVTYLVGDAAGEGNLVAVMPVTTGSGRTEAHILSRSSWWKTFTLHMATPLGLISTDNVSFGLGPADGDTVPDLFVILRQATGSGMVEVHALSGASGMSQWVVHAATELPLGTDSRFPVRPLN